MKMQEIMSQQMRQIRIIDEDVKRQLKKMLKEQGYELDVLYDESTSYVIADADGYEYEIKTFNESLDGYPIKEIIYPWVVDLMKFHSEWHHKYQKAFIFSA